MHIFSIIFEGRDKDNILYVSEVVEILIDVLRGDIPWNFIDVELMIIIVSLDIGKTIPNFDFLERLEH